MILNFLKKPMLKLRLRRKSQSQHQNLRQHQPLHRLKSLSSLSKKKRVISEKQKAQLVENLKRGRETSLANRIKKKKLNAIAKEEKMVEEDTKVFESLKKKLKPKQLEDENTRLKQELAELKAAKAEAKRERASTPPPSSVENKIPEVKKMPTIPEVKKPLTSRQKLQMMRGL